MTFYDARTALMHLQELSIRGEEGLEVPPSAIVTLESLAEQTQLQLQGMILYLLPPICSL
jgi:hypothetical protein